MSEHENRREILGGGIRQRDAVYLAGDHEDR